MGAGTRVPASNNNPDLGGSLHQSQLICVTSVDGINTVVIDLIGSNCTSLDN